MPAEGGPQNRGTDHRPGVWGGVQFHASLWDGSSGLSEMTVRDMTSAGAILQKMRTVELENAGGTS